MLVLGIDPGTYHVGYGLICVGGGKQELVDFGVFRVSRQQSFPSRLKDIYASAIQLIQANHPDVMVIEESFFSKNAKTALTLGHARGVLMLAGAQEELPIFEYAPREIKQSVTGNGGATKDQVQWMVQQTLGIKDKLPEDAADALAVALCHVYRSNNPIGNLKR